MSKEELDERAKAIIENMLYKIYIKPQFERMLSISNMVFNTFIGIIKATKRNKKRK